VRIIWLNLHPELSCPAPELVTNDFVTNLRWDGFIKRNQYSWSVKKACPNEYRSTLYINVGGQTDMYIEMNKVYWYRVRGASILS
jgi:hypothetical protein